MENNLKEKIDSATNEFRTLISFFKVQIEEREQKIEVLFNQLSKKEAELNTLIDKTQKVLSSVKEMASSFDNIKDEMEHLIENEDIASEKIITFNNNYKKITKNLTNFEQTLNDDIAHYHDKKNQEDLSYRSMAMRFGEFDKKMKQVEQSDLFKKIFGSD